MAVDKDLRGAGRCGADFEVCEVGKICRQVQASGEGLLGRPAPEAPIRTAVAKAHGGEAGLRHTNVSTTSTYYIKTVPTQVTDAMEKLQQHCQFRYLATKVATDTWKAPASPAVN
jgi:hypothetical protein